MLALLLLGCGGRSGQVAPVPEAELALRNFMQAAADSNFNGMAEHWGTSRGSAAATGNPADFQQRMVIVQAFLKGIRYRVLSNDADPTSANQRVLQVELSRDNCLNLVPFTMARTSQDKWVVYQFDLEKVGAPSRGCTSSGSAPRN